MNDRLKKQMEFLAICDDMKKISRRTMLSDKSRPETDAEHSWHFALMALMLCEYADKIINIDHVIKMALVHDLIEIYAGDTFAYDAEGMKTKTKRENSAADKLFNILPDDQKHEYRELWEEFEAGKTNDSKYANAIDRLQPIINNYRTQGYTWRDGSVTSDMVYARIRKIKDASETLYSVADAIVKDSINKGWLKEC